MSEFFNGGTPGAIVSPGRYALDWLQSLGGTAALDAAGTGLVITMPVGPDGLPTPWPQELQALVQNYRNSLMAAIQGKVYPPGSDQLPSDTNPPVLVDSAYQI
jgi:hypothetical protein